MMDLFSPNRGEVTATFGTRDSVAVKPLVRFEAVSRRFGDIVAIDQLSLDIYDREFFALLGPSGCGKSTLLRMLAGFERPNEGRILLDGVDIVDVPPHRRPVNMMFQSYALFPHLSVAGNIAFGLKQDSLPNDAIEARVREVLALLQLDGLGARKPHQLSGGQRQRVALARAIVKRPRVLLLDEPLSALDRKLRENTRFELMELQHRLGLTFIMVTHDQDEAMATSDRIGLMHQGRLMQVGTPSEIYEQPNSRWVADFIGDINLIEAELIESGPAGSLVQSTAGPLRTSQPVDVPPGTMLWFAVRPEKIWLAAESSGAADENCLVGTVLDIGYLGDASTYKVKLDNGNILKASMPNRHRRTEQPFDRGHRVFLTWPGRASMVLTQ